MFCPSCKDAVLQMSERIGIEIDYCPTCRGVWLDRGELDKIIEKSNQASAPTQAPNHALSQATIHPSDLSQVFERGRSHDYKYKRKKSFLEEIFD